MALSDEDRADVVGIVEEALKPLAELGEKVERAGRAAENAHALAEEAKEGAGGVDEERVKALAAETVRAALDQATREADERREAEAEAERARQARAGWLSANAGHVPVAYHTLIPGTDDEQALQAGLEKAAEAFTADVASGKYGVRPASVGASGPAGPVRDQAALAEQEPARRLETIYAGERGEA